MNDIERRERRLERARTAVYAELAIGVAVTLLTVFLIITAPSGLDPMFIPYKPSLLEQLFPWVVVPGPIIGLAWMVRLARPPVDDGEDSWRFHL
jgi:ABC-type spermidine/putrescine transport system permease subunit II